jgi:hypothetical protein
MDCDEHPGARPILRATITRDRITLNPRLRGTITGGPAAMTLARLPSGVTLVDLRHAGEDDDALVATVPPNAPRLAAAARRTLARWAAVVGYRRLWLPDRVIELDPDAAPRTAAVECPTCTATWSDDSDDFWAAVRAAGHFPGYCPACGGSLPEWRAM